jgi:HK97 family phage major capsid protein
VSARLEGPIVAAFRRYEKDHLMNSKTLIEQRNKLMHDAGTLMQSETITPEIRTSFDKMMADVDVLNADIDRAERSEKFAAEQRNATRPPRSQPGAGDNSVAPDAQREKRAFREWMQTGRISEENRAYLRHGETRDLGAGAVAAPITGGNVLVPVGFDPQLNIAMKSYGQIVGAVRNFKTESGEQIKVALASDVAQMVTVIPEATAAVENDPGLSGFVSSTDELTTGLIRVSNQLLQDSAFDVDAFISEMFAARYYRGLANMIVNGNGSNIQKLAPSQTIQLPTGDSTAVTYGSLTQVYGALDPAYQPRAQWLMNSATRSALMALRDNYGRPLLQTDTTGRPFNSIFGADIVIAQGMPNFGPNNTAIMLGDVAASYTLRTVQGGLQIARSNERFFEYNETAFIGFARAGGYNTSQASSSSLIGLQNSAA